MIPYITIQKMSHRGPRFAVRLVGTQYAFEWNENLRCYAMRISDSKTANRLLDGLLATRMLVPGLAFVDESGKAIETLEQAEEPKTAPVVKEATSAIEEPALMPRAELPAKLEKVEPLEDGEHVHHKNTKRKTK